MPARTPSTPNCRPLNRAALVKRLQAAVERSRTDPTAFAAHGYAVLSYSGLGFGGSGCKITLDDPDWDGKAARQLVDYLAGLRPDTDGQRLDMIRLDGPGDPRVGMIGGSYGGQAQFALAGLDHRVDALIPLITWNDLAYSLAPNNGGTNPGVHKKEWTSLFFAEGIADGVAGAQYDPGRLIGCPNFTDAACAAKAELDLLGYPTADTTALDSTRCSSLRCSGCRSSWDRTGR